MGVHPLYPTPETLFNSYPITWIITGAFQIGVYLFVRKRAFARVAPTEKPHLAVEGHHPSAEE